MNNVPSEEKEILWLPNIIFKNTENLDELINDAKAFIAIMKLGTYVAEDDEVLENRLLYKGSENPIRHSRPYAVDLTCIYNMGWYPFDVQNCTVEIMMQGNSKKSVRLISDSIEYLGPMELSQYFVKRMTIHHDDSKVWAEIILGRRLLSTILTVYVPTFLLNVISYATNFFKDFFFEAVVTVNLTAMLVLTTMFISTSTSLPTTSATSLTNHQHPHPHVIQFQQHDRKTKEINSTKPLKELEEISVKDDNKTTSNKDTQSRKVHTKSPDPWLESLHRGLDKILFPGGCKL